MAEDYITPKELETALEAERKKAEEGEKKKKLASTADVTAAIEAYDKKKDEEDKKEWVKEWDHWVATELNSIKSEFTVFKMEWVPILATLPSLFSFEELLMQKYNLTYHNGFLQTEGMVERRQERAYNRARDEAYAENERRNAEESRRNQPPADGTPPPGTRPPGTQPPGDGTRPPGTTPPGGRPTPTPPPRPQPPPNQPPAPGPRTRTPAPRPDPVAPVGNSLNQARPEIRGGTGDLNGLQQGLRGASNAADGGS
ncbi:hypothetical protein [Streptomyces sp. Je 1-79]|uniref:hypothetical protein n=1 Tax=Streptomyces sp. Je 1-79 TaxID=2943847 RepID=UPI0021BCD690|nr:hypothetical protein [Streptomyces sp. Je 1-79]